MLKGIDNSLFYKIYTKWITTYTLLAFAIYFIIPFPLLLLVSMGFTLIMNAILKGDKLKKIVNKLLIFTSHINSQL
jgi:hypothetical protein